MGVDRVEKGLVFNIKRFAVHDGDGIRTTVFLKGCPLRCSWCHNPEGIYMDRKIWHVHPKCVGCGECLRVCKTGAVTLSSDRRITFEGAKCISCGNCAEICPTMALCWDSEWMTVDELMEVLLRDIDAYVISRGGVTLSGGEPLYAQRSYALELLRRLNREGIHTTVESSLYVDTKALKAFLPVVDYFICDIKVIESDRHRKHTGVGNERILENIRMIAGKKPMLIRIPMISGCTDDIGNVTAIADYISELKAGSMVQSELLNLNPLYMQKYSYLGESIDYKGVRLSETDMKIRCNLFKERGISCRIG